MKQPKYDQCEDCGGTLIPRPFPLLWARLILWVGDCNRCRVAKVLATYLPKALYDAG